MGVDTRISGAGARLSQIKAVLVEGQWINLNIYENRSTSYGWIVLDDGDDNEYSAPMHILIDAISAVELNPPEKGDTT